LGSSPCHPLRARSLHRGNTYRDLSREHQSDGRLGGPTERELRAAGKYKVVTVFNQSYSAGPELTLTANYAGSKVPTDYFTGIMNPTRFQVAGLSSTAVYSGSADNSICTNDLNNDYNYAAGSGIKYRSVTLQ
jgi:hypothetical protein